MKPYTWHIHCAPPVWVCQPAKYACMRALSLSLLLDTVTYIILCKGDRTCLLDRIYCWPLLLLLLLLLHSFHSCVHCVNLLWYVCALTLTHCTHQHWHCVVVIYCRQRYFPFERMAFAAKSQAFNAHIHLHTCTLAHNDIYTYARSRYWLNGKQQQQRRQQQQQQYSERQTNEKQNTRILESHTYYRARVYTKETTTTTQVLEILRNFI